MFCSKENKPLHGEMCHQCPVERPSARWWAHHNYRHHHHHNHHSHHMHTFLWLPEPEHSRHHGHCHSHHQHGHSKPNCFFRGMPINENLHGLQKMFDYSENYN